MLVTTLGSMTAATPLSRSRTVCHEWISMLVMVSAVATLICLFTDGLVQWLSATVALTAPALAHCLITVHPGVIAAVVEVPDAGR